MSDIKHQPPLAVTDMIAQYAAEVPISEPEALRDCVLHAFIDTIGVAIAARRDPGLIRLLRATADEQSPGGSTILPTGQRVAPAYAAFVNGMAAHALDYDDVGDPMYGHPSAALVPALLAVGQQEQATGPDLLDAYAVGYQVAMAISAVLPIRAHYARGWHSSATVGVLAATAALGHLLRLPIPSIRTALGIAASTASGSRQNFGTQTKPLHLGLSARNAVTAVRLARAGFTADQAQLEAPLGYFAMYGADSDLDAIPKFLSRPWAVLQPGLGATVKKYPCCFNTHRTADAALTLASQLTEPAAQVSRVSLTVEPGGFDPLIHHRPVTGTQAKFSAEYVIAAALTDGRLDMASFTDDAVARPVIRGLLERVDIAESPDPPFGGGQYEFAYAALEVEAAGRIWRERVDVPRGDSRSPLSRADIEAKFRDCVGTSGVPWAAEDVLSDIVSMAKPARPAGFPHLEAAPISD